MGTSAKVYEMLDERAPGLTIAEIAAKVKPKNVRDPIVATRSAVMRLRNAGKARGEKCVDGKFRYRRA